MLFPYVILGWVALAHYIGFFPALGIVVVVYILAWCAEAAREWRNARKACEHGIRAGARGGCQVCLAEEARMEAEREVQAVDQARRQAIDDGAKRLREEEIERLSKAWLSNTEAYFQMTPLQFECAIAELFKRLGYEVIQTPFSNDGGKDAIARKDGKKYLIECKRYASSNSIGRRDVQIFVAAMQDEKADGGFYINTGIFTRTATKYAAINRIDLYDRLTLSLLVNRAYPISADASRANVMCLECGAVTSMPVLDDPVTGVCSNGHSVSSNIVKANFRIFSSSDIPYCDRCGALMKLVSGRRGRFWGCPRYPACGSIKPLTRRGLR